MKLSHCLHAQSIGSSSSMSMKLGAVASSGILLPSSSGLLSAHEHLSRRTCTRLNAASLQQEHFLEWIVTLDEHVD